MGGLKFCGVAAAVLLLLALLVLPEGGEAGTKKFKFDLKDICKDTPEVVGATDFEDCMEEFRKIVSPPAGLLVQQAINIKKNRFM